MDANAIPAMTNIVVHSICGFAAVSYFGAILWCCSSPDCRIDCAGAPTGAPDFSSMFNSLNMGAGGMGMGMGGFGVPAAAANPETAYATQLEQLRVRPQLENAVLWCMHIQEEVGQAMWKAQRSQPAYSQEQQ